jgi:Spy/CpxP family protein refolding chaperone
MLRHRGELELSQEQIRTLERLRNDFQREAIRREADLRIAETDLTNLLDAEAVELGQVEAKVREIERLRADLRLARIRTIEEGKAQLSSEQRKKLQALLAEPRYTHLR